ncbi:MAG: hypothetical protein JRJ14_09695, partial [Deltaproteobacteria bacterium]|nr:hypothetical protein [Deltaproteobacteria bacterium]
MEKSSRHIEMKKAHSNISAGLIPVLRVFLLTLCVIVLSSHCLGETAETEFEKVFSDKIRAGYVNKYYIDLVPKMKQSGMNLAMVKYSETNTPLKLYQFKSIEKWARACQVSGLNFMPVINFWGKHEKVWIKPNNKLYYNVLEYSQTPCPLDAGVYRQSIHTRVLQLARLSRKLPIAGVMIDLETYGADIRSFPDLCLCNNCFKQFLTGKTAPNPILLHERQDYLKRTGQLDAYKVFMEDIVADWARKTKEQAEAIAPNFFIGAYLLDRDTTFYKGLARGFGSRDKPALAFTGETYRKGYSLNISETIKRFNDNRINIRLICGIWQEKFPVENLAEHYYHCAKNSAGYWIYDMGSLSETKKNELPFPRSQYWHAIDLGNSQLDLLTTDPIYKSPLKIRPFRMLQRKVDVGDFDRLQYAKASGSPVKTAPFMFRKSNVLVFLAQKGDSVRFEMKYAKYARYEGSFARLALIDRNGTVLVANDATVAANGVLSLTAPYTGTYAITMESGMNGVIVVSHSHPYSIDVGGPMHFTEIKQ